MEETKIKTRRHVVSFLSLLFYTLHTINIPLRDIHPLLRLYAAIASLPSSWDAPVVVKQNFLPLITHVVDRVCLGEMVRPIRIPPPQQHYDFTIVVDACAGGWGAWIVSSFERFELSGRWDSAVNASAHSEPLAATRVLTWLASRDCFRKLEAPSIAVITDHEPMVTAQRVCCSGNRGFSLNPYLNAFFVALYAAPHAASRSVQPARDVFHIAGALNPVDGLSRAALRCGLVAQAMGEKILPRVADLFHPYRAHIARKLFEV